MARMWTVSLCVFLHIFRPCLSAIPTIVKIGGLFEGDEEEERTFRHAVERANAELLSRVRLVALSKNIIPKDSFHAAKAVCELVEEGALIITGPRSPSVSSVVRATCERLHLPYIDTLTSARGNYSISLHPEPSSLGQAYLDLVRAWNWKAFTLVYQDDAGLLRYQELLQAAPPFQITLQQLQPGQTYKGLFKQITRTGETNLLLDIPAHLVLEALKITHDLGLMTEYHNYFLTSLDVHTVNLEPFQYGATNISGYHLVSSPSNGEPTLGFRRTWDEFRPGHRRNDQKPVSTRLALLQDAVRLAARALEDYRLSLPPGSLSCRGQQIWPPGHLVVAAIRGAKTQGITGEIKINQDGKRTDFVLDVVELKRGGLVKVGSWKPEVGVKITRNYSQLYQDVGDSLKNKTLRVTTVVNPPYASLKPEDKLLTGNDRFEGFCVDICRELARLLQFKFELRLARDSQYGARNVRGEWTGMIRELVDREADFAIGDLTITREREEAVDFTTPFMTIGIGVLIRRPYRPPKLFYLLSPLTPEVWAYLGGAYIGVSVLLYLLARFSPYEWVPGVGGYFRNQFSLANSLWFTMGSLMQQGCDISPRALSTRLVAAFWWFFTLVVVSTYTANLAALLIAERIKSPIETAEDLSKQSTVQYGCVEDGSTRDFFRESNNEAYSRMFHAMEHAKPRVYVPSLQEGVARVVREAGTYALLAESASLEFAAAQHCELVAVGGLLNARGYGIATPSGSPYRSLLSNALLRLQEDGTIQTLKERWWKPKECPIGGASSPEGSEPTGGPLDLTKLGGVFVLLLSGLGLSCVLAICEFIWKTKKMVREERKSKENED